MEARLTEISYEARLTDDLPDRMMLAARVDRYLRAAGAQDNAQRGRLIVATARDLRTRSSNGDPTWAEIIAAVDRHLAAEFRVDAAREDAPTSRGRVALCMAPGSGAEWATPPREHRTMPPQELSLWRPDTAWLRQLQFGRSAQGLAASLCWLAVLVIP